MIRRRFLFVLWNGGGNVPPMVRIGARLTQAGHAVHVLANPSLASTVERAGLQFLPFVHGPDHDPASPAGALEGSTSTSSLGAADRARERLLFGPATPIARDTLDAIARIDPDVVGVDYVMFGGLIAAEAARLPAAVLVPHIYPLARPQAARRGTFGYLFERLIEGGLASLNRSRQGLGLGPLAAAREQYERADLMLLTTYRAFDSPCDGMLPSVRYVGAQLPIPSQLPPVEARDAEKPLVVVSFSTAWQNQADVVRALLVELSRLPVTTLFLTGPALSRAHFDVPANVLVRDFVPHAELLPRAAAVVCHGGHGSVIGALNHGVPLLCVPFEQDQFDVSRRAAELGAAIALSRASSPSEMRSAFERLLGDPRLREGARNVSAAFLAEDEPNRAAQELASICHARSRETAAAP